MALRLRNLRLRAETAETTFGADIVFSKGLNILWADNTMGKSTALQAILYALGLERMLSARREIPLTYVMTSHLVDPTSGAELNVHESSVAVELSNERDEIITVRRNVVGGNHKLVSVFHGPMLSNGGGSYKQTDFFVLDPGAAQREAGFHRFFAEFLGWKLPIVRRNDGSETPLYLETIFPLLYVEQKSGWSSIPAAFPLYLQIRDVSKRAVEFLLALETHELEFAKQQIEIDLAALRSDWNAKRYELTTVARTGSGRVVGLSTTPSIAAEDLEQVSLEVQHNRQWTPINDVIEVIATTVAILNDAPVPTVKEIAPEAHAALEQASALLNELNAQRITLLREYRTEQSQFAAAERRIAALQEDLQKNLDVLKLRKLGSTVPTSTLAPEHCPTCDQPIQDTLLPQKEVGTVMPIEDNVEYIRTQLSMFEQVHVQANTLAADAASKLQSINTEVLDASARLRAIRTDLAASEETPSASAIAERLQLEHRLSTLVTLNEQFEREKAGVRELGDRARRLAEDKARLPTDRFTAKDKEKLAKLGELLRSQAREYGFSTFDPSEIAVSEDTYRPEKEGFEIGFQLSASDAIRLKWAYQLALLELGRSERTNHPGCVIFDEPRQQEARRLSFQRLLEHASGSLLADEQVIFATSEDIEQLRSYVGSLQCNLIEFPNKIVTALAKRSQH